MISKKHHTNTIQGLTSIELVVVFSIFAALATSVLFSYREFTSNIRLQNLSQDIALQIRQIQNLSVSGSYPALVSGQVPPTGSWAPSFGMYVSTDPEQNKNIVLFFDRNTEAISNPEEFDFGDRQIPSSDIDCNLSDIESECLDIIQITGGEFISEIVLDEFSYDQPYDSVDDLHIVFVRPLNRAYLSYTGMDDDNEEYQISDASIYLESPDGKRSVVRITATGQIIVE